MRERLCACWCSLTTNTGIADPSMPDSIYTLMEQIQSNATEDRGGGRHDIP